MIIHILKIDSLKMYTVGACFVCVSACSHVCRHTFVHVLMVMSVCVCVHVNVPMCKHVPVTMLGRGELDTGDIPPPVFSLFAEEEFLTKPRSPQFTSLPWESHVGTSEAWDYR